MALLLLLSAAASTWAQIGLNVSTERAAYLRYEPIDAEVHVRNLSGNTLVFGRDNAQEGGELRFVITDRSGLLQPRLEGGANPAAGLILTAGETKAITVRLNSFYNFHEEGEYVIRVRLEHPRLRQAFLSSPVTVRVTAGMRVWHSAIGIPVHASDSQIPEREVGLFLVHEGSEDVYCLRVEDSRSVYGVVRLGQRMSANRPQCDVDAVSSIHTLLQIRPRLYQYRVFDYNLNLKQEQLIASAGQPPQLVRDTDLGTVSLGGGGRLAVRGVDYEVNDENRGRIELPGPPSSPEASGADETQAADQAGGADEEAAAPEPRETGGFLRRLFRFGRD